jgi:2-dehydropantoate 2-reductase
MKIAVVGAGGVGGYFGARLAAAGADVHFLARGAHLEAMRARGLRVESPKGSLHLAHVNATDDPRAIGACDVVMFCVKLYDAERAVASLPPLVGADTIVLPFQNGVESVGLLTRSVGAEHTGGGTAYITAVIAEPGVIRHTVMDSIFVGELDGRRSERLERFVEACAPAGFKATLSDNIEIDIWTKFVRLSVFSGMTAVTRCSIGPIVRDPDLMLMLLAALREARAVAVANGVAVPESITASVQEAYGRMAPEAKSSMLHDLERGRRLELPWLSGAVARLGIEAGVATPIHSFIATVLRPHVMGLQGPEGRERQEGLDGQDRRVG